MKKVVNYKLDTYVSYYIDLLYILKFVSASLKIFINSFCFEIVFYQIKIEFIKKLIDKKKLA